MNNIKEGYSITVREEIKNIYYIELNREDDLSQNIIVKEKIAKITFLMKDVLCPCTLRKQKVQ